MKWIFPTERDTFELGLNVWDNRNRTLCKFRQKLLFLLELPVYEVSDITVSPLSTNLDSDLLVEEDLFTLLTLLNCTLFFIRSKTLLEAGSVEGVELGLLILDDPHQKLTFMVRFIGDQINLEAMNPHHRDLLPEQEIQLSSVVPHAV